MDTKPKRFLTPEELCERWQGVVTKKTLCNWRSTKNRLAGPRHVKIGGRILYPLENVEAYEKRMPKRRTPTNGDPSPTSPLGTKGGVGAMTPKELESLAKGIFGDGWRKPLATLIVRVPKQVRNYESGHTPIPRAIADQVREFADIGREGEIIKAAVLRHLPRTKRRVAHLIAREAVIEIRKRRNNP